MRCYLKDMFLDQNGIFEASSCYSVLDEEERSQKAMKAVDDDEGSPPPMKRPMSMKDMMMRVVVTAVGLKEASWFNYFGDAVLMHL